MTNALRGRLATAVASLFLLLAASVGPAGAINQVAPADGETGRMICGNCGPNKTTTTGTATGGSVTNNSNGTSNTSMSYVTPIRPSRFLRMIRVAALCDSAAAPLESMVTAASAPGGLF